MDETRVMLSMPSSVKVLPCDVAVSGPLKAAYRGQVNQLERGGVDTIGKEHFTSLYSPTRDKAFTARNIKASFAISSLVPFNLERMPQTPATPLTPVSADALMLLQNLIIKHNARTLNKATKQRLQRHVQKFVNAAKICFAKVQQTTKSEILARGKGKVMSYKDLKAVQVARAAKEQAKAKGKGKHSQKRKTPVEAEATEPKAKVAWMSKAQREDEVPLESGS
ncbi:hypothetical protein BCR34DRAFT_628888 [Clohesyomyces aquaticus]|uniref:Uncharacterized protein n=1 Tax=Clohesyomyces aquaticus TaxID=1231657 RepID=A0A1Y1YDX1_9PLEO|nr:hypothetical protein BCR34DRAFT_628888 [Clohesyomyces aquaticus]